MKWNGVRAVSKAARATSSARTNITKRMSAIHAGRFETANEAVIESSELRAGGGDRR
jgi:hypothetical protein